MSYTDTGQRKEDTYIFWDLKAKGQGHSDICPQRGPLRLCQCSNGVILLAPVGTSGLEYVLSTPLSVVRGD